MEKLVNLEKHLQERTANQAIALRRATIDSMTTWQHYKTLCLMTEGQDFDEAIGNALSPHYKL